MLSKLLYYLFLKPLSFLPLPVLYIVSDGVYFVLYYLIGYRKKVVFKNLKNSFPEKTEKELKNISKQFYAHLCDVIIESVRFFSMPESEAIKRCRCRNPEILNNYAKQKKSVVLGFGHYGNWELTLSFSAYTLHKTLILFKPLKNKFFNQKIKSSRQKYGANLISLKNMRKVIETDKSTPCVIVFGTDQNPTGHEKKLFWMDFLNQETAVNIGMEKYAKKYNTVVLWLQIHKIKRGYYEFEFIVVEENPLATEYGDITKKCTKILENKIVETPQYWLWSHKRWKRKKEIS